MAIKHFKKNTKKKTKKVKSSVTIDEEEGSAGGGFCGLPNSSKMKKKKHLVKQKDPDKKDTKKKKQEKKDSELNNKACVNLSILRESSSDSESLTDPRKKPQIAKNKRDRLISCDRESNCEFPQEDLPKEQEGSNFLNRLARKRSVPISIGEDVEFIVKKKKKKKGGKEGHKHACALMLLTKDEAPKQIFPNPKVISQDTPLSSREKGPTDVQYGAGDVVKKKKAAFSVISVDDRESGKVILEAGIGSTGGRFHKGQLCKSRTRGNEQQQQGDRQVLEEETEAISQKWGKKKKKKPKKEKAALFVTLASSQTNSSGENSLISKSKTRLCIDPEPDANEDGKKTKKKQTQPKIGSNRLALLKDGKDVSVMERKEKKGKKPGVLQVHAGSGNEDRVEKKKKKGKDSERIDFESPVEGEPGLRKAKMTREGKQRRQTLQDEIDQESCRTEVIKKEKELDNHFGQWGSAVLENSERKAKFLRLLGGFKKGPSVPALDSPASTTKLNMAHNKSQEKERHQSLEAEFEKAIKRKHRSGTGLGFQPAAQKQTHIDKYASKSIKFED